jgi:hypothetical protein
VEPLSAYRIGVDLVPRPALLIGFANTRPVVMRRAVSIVVDAIERERSETLLAREDAFSK